MGLVSVEIEEVVGVVAFVAGEFIAEEAVDLVGVGGAPVEQGDILPGHFAAGGGFALGDFFQGIAVLGGVGLGVFAFIETHGPPLGLLDTDDFEGVGVEHFADVALAGVEVVDADDACGVGGVEILDAIGGGDAEAHAADGFAGAVLDDTEFDPGLGFGFGGRWGFGGGATGVLDGTSGAGLGDFEVEMGAQRGAEEVGDAGVALDDFGEILGDGNGIRRDVDEIEEVAGAAEFGGIGGAELGEFFLKEGDDGGGRFLVFEGLKVEGDEGVFEGVAAFGAGEILFLEVLEGDAGVVGGGARGGGDEGVVQPGGTQEGLEDAKGVGLGMGNSAVGAKSRVISAWAWGGGGDAEAAGGGKWVEWITGRAGMPRGLGRRKEPGPTAGSRGVWGHRGEATGMLGERPAIVFDPVKMGGLDRDEGTGEGPRC